MPITSNNIIPGMTINLDGKVYRVEACAKASVAKGSAFIKTKLRDLLSDKLLEKNFKLNQQIDEVFLQEHALEFLYLEDGSYIFLDISNLQQVKVSLHVLKDKISFLKEGIQVRAMFYGDAVFSVELPQFLELMVVKVEEHGKKDGKATTKQATLETGAVLNVPLFIEVGDIIKVDTIEKEYIQRI
jgi:elongation factor P